MSLMLGSFISASCFALSSAPAEICLCHSRGLSAESLPHQALHSFQNHYLIRLLIWSCFGAVPRGSGRSPPHHFIVRIMD